MKTYAFLFAPFFFSLALAQIQEVPPPWTHQSEVGIITVSGNTETESYSAKQLTTYHWGLDSISGNARYLETKDHSLVTAKNWDLELRYDKSLSELWYLFISQKAEADTFAGFIQKDTSNLGAKYIIRKTAEMNWLAEAGFSYAKTYTTAYRNEYDPSTRVYTNVTKKFSKANQSLEFSLEYLQSIRRSYVYFLNSELAFSAMLSDKFSLKTSYLLKYHNDRVPPSVKYTDTTFTTSLVAKF